MTIVQHKLTDAAGNPLVNVRVPIRLATNGYVTVDKREIVRTITVSTDATGTYQADLLPQSQIDPAGTHYEVTHPAQTAGSAPTEVLSFVVSDATGPLWLRDLLVENPAQPSPVYAGNVTGAVIDDTTPSTSTVYSSEKVSTSYVPVNAALSAVSYDAAGNVTGYTEGGVAYAITYDSAGNVETVTANGTTRTVSYDSAGNVTGVA